MASYAGLLLLRGPWGHTVLDLPQGVLEAATQTVPPDAVHSFVATLLHKCSNSARDISPIKLADVLLCTALFECPGISKAHLVAFRRRIWPRKTIAQLKWYHGIVRYSPGLRFMDPKLRQLVEAVFAQESDWVRDGVLQHLVDGHRTQLVTAPRGIEVVLTGEAPSMTIPDDRRLHQLLRQLHAEVHAELRRQGKVVDVCELPPAVPPALAGQLQGGSSGSLAEGGADGQGPPAPAPVQQVAAPQGQVPQPGPDGLLGGLQRLCGVRQSVRQWARSRMEHMLELCSVDPDWRPLVLDHLHRELYPPVKTMHSRLITARKLVLGLLPAAEQGAVDSAWPAVTGPMLFRYIEDLAGMSPLRRWLLDVVEALDGYPYNFVGSIISVAVVNELRSYSGRETGPVPWAGLLVLLVVIQVLQLFDPMRTFPW